MGDEESVLATMTAWAHALERKDVDAMLADYEAEAVLYDIAGQHVGVEAIRALWRRRLPHFPAKFRSRHDDVRIIAGQDVAILAAVHRLIVPGEPDHAISRSGARVTVAYRWRAGRWRVVHEHASVPFDVAAGRPIVV